MKWLIAYHVRELNPGTFPRSTIHWQLHQVTLRYLLRAKSNYWYSIRFTTVESWDIITIFRYSLVLSFSISLLVVDFSYFPIFSLGDFSFAQLPYLSMRSLHLHLCFLLLLNCHIFTSIICSSFMQPYSVAICNIVQDIIN